MTRSKQAKRPGAAAEDGIDPEEVTRIIDGKMEELGKSIDKRVEDLLKGIVSGLEERLSKQISARMQESPSSTPASAAQVSPPSRGIFPTLASVSNKKDKEKLASLVERRVH